MHLRARAPRAFTGLSFGTEATYPNVIILSKIRQCRGFLPSRRIRCAAKAIPTPTLPLLLDTLHPPTASIAIGGEALFRSELSALTYEEICQRNPALCTSRNYRLSPQKRKLPVSSCSVRSTKSRHRYFEDLRLWKVHSPVSCIRAYHLVIERPSSSKIL